MKFTQQQSEEMLSMLKEIHSQLNDKRKNTHFNKLRLYEMLWFYGIGNFLKELKNSGQKSRSDSRG